MSKEEIDPKQKLRAKLEVQKIARSGLTNSYEQLDKWIMLHKDLKKKNKEVTNLEFKIAFLQDQIDLIEDNATNMQYGGPIDGGIGYGGCGGSGCDAG
jgi:hypothetical protein